jgi:hypothetical protein
MGGREPVTGFHSVMLRPDSVRRVSPPRITIPNTEAAEAMRKMPTDLLFVSGKEEVFEEDCVVDCALSSAVASETLPAKELAGGA